jgi:hypothetical protein
MHGIHCEATANSQPMRGISNHSVSFRWLYDSMLPLAASSPDLETKQIC